MVRSTPATAGHPAVGRGRRGRDHRRAAGRAPCTHGRLADRLRRFPTRSAPAHRSSESAVRSRTCRCRAASSFSCTRTSARLSSRRASPSPSGTRSAASLFWRLFASSPCLVSARPEIQRRGGVRVLVPGRADRPAGLRSTPLVPQVGCPARRAHARRVHTWTSAGDSERPPHRHRSGGRARTAQPP